MKKNIIRPLLFATIGLFFLTCKAQQPPASSQNSLMIFDKNTDTIRTSQGAAFVIQLESSYGNGYEWQLQEPEKMTTISLDSTSVMRPSDYQNNATLEKDEKIWEKFHFTAIEKGTMRLHFAQVRAWDKSSVQDSVDFRIIIE